MKKLKLRLFYMLCFALFTSACSEAIKNWVKDGTGAPPASSNPSVATHVYAWDFSNSQKYTFDAKYLNVTNGKVSLNEIDQFHSGNDLNDGSHNGTCLHNGLVTLRRNGGCSADDHNLSDVKFILPSVENNLIGYWRFDGDYLDQSAGNNNAVSVGANIITDAKIGVGAVNIDGSSYVDMGDVASFESLPQLSISLWVKLDTIGPLSTVLGKERVYKLQIGPTGTVGFFTETVSVGWILLSSNNLLSAGKWHHVALTYDGVVKKIYIDGVQELTTQVMSGTTLDNARRFLIGGYDSGGGVSENFTGAVDEVSLWNIALTSSQLQQIYTAQNLLFSQDTELSLLWTPKWNNIVGYWKMDGNWQDSSGNLNHGTANSLPSFSSDAKINASGQFDGVDDYISIVDNSSFDFSDGNFSIIGWAKLEKGAGTSEGLIGIGSIPRIRIDVNTINDLVFENFDSNTSGLAPFVKIDRSTSRWFHFAMVRDNDSDVVAIYIDGKLAASSPDSRTGSFDFVGTWRIGRNSSNLYIQGKMDDIAIFNAPLDIRDIQTIYNWQKQKYAGYYDSLIIDLESPGAWSNFIPVTTLPFYKELTASNELLSHYSNLVNLDGLPADSDLADTSLIGLWHFNEVGFNSVMGFDFQDYSSGATKHHAEENGTVSFTEGRFLGGIELDGVDDRMEVQSHLDFDNSNGSISLWFKTKGDWEMGGGSADDSAVLYARHDAISSYNGISLLLPKGDRVSLQIKDASSVICYANSVSLVNDNKWHQVVLTYSYFIGEKNIVYVDGIKLMECTNSASWTFNSQHIEIGASLDPWWEEFKGEVDEFAIWSRTLHVTEVQQLYRRGANRIKYQVRSCIDPVCKCKSLDAAGDASDCDGDGTPNANDLADLHFTQWLGNNGASGGTFSELQNCSSIDAVTGECDTAGMATVNSNSSDFEFSLYPAAARPAHNRYFQYRISMEAEDNAVCSGAACLPELTSVEVGPSGRYHYGIHLITATDSVDFSDLVSMSFTEAGSCTLSYQLSADGSNYYYWNGSGWVPASGAAQSTTGTDVSANVATFASQAGIGNLYWQAFINSSSAQFCDIESISVEVVP